MVNAMGRQLVATTESSTPTARRGLCPTRTMPDEDYDGQQDERVYKSIRARAFGEKVESLIVDSHDGAIPTGAKGASHEWGSLIPTICANVSLRQSKPVIAV